MARSRSRNRDDDEDSQYDKRDLQDAASKKLAAGLCGILLGAWGIHKFILGYTNAGILQIVITFATCGMAGFIGLIEGIIYLTKSDEEFYETYILNQKEWF
jgi:TM2 domain-containing membrane protein YozV